MVETACQLEHQEFLDQKEISPIQHDRSYVDVSKFVLR